MDVSIISADKEWASLLLSDAQVRVDSVFHNAFAITCEPRGDLYTIFYKDGYPAPRVAIIDASAAVYSPKIGDVGRVSSGTLSLPGLLASSKSCVYEDNTIDTLKLPSPEQVRLVESWLEKHSVAGSFYFDETSDDIQRATGRRLANVRKLFISEMEKGESSLEDSLSQLVGLGVGLTPSGDDYIVGWLAVMQSMGVYGDKIDKLRTVIPGLLHRTTKVSDVYISAALQKQFAQPVRDFCAAAASDGDVIGYAESLLDHGATSGQDILTGIIDAWKMSHKERGNHEKNE